MAISQFKWWTHIAVIGLASVYLVSCGLSTKSSIEVKKSIQRSSTMTAISPPVAKASEAITVTGTNLSSNGAYMARFTLADGSIKDVPLSVIDSTKASFLMPEGLGLGEKSVEMVKGTRTITTFSVVADEAANTLSIFTGEASKICSTDSYIDKTGAKKTGTKDCAAGTVADCAVAGITGCKTTTTIIGAEQSLLTAANIKSGVTLAGVLGTFAGNYSNCTSDGATGCVATATYTAALTTGAASKILLGQSVAGVAGNVTLPAASNVRTGNGTFGVAGTATTPTLADCSADGGIGCVTTASYKAALMTSAISGNILSGATIAGVAGNVTASPGSCSTNGVTGCVTTTTYKSGDLTNLTAGNIKSGVVIAGATGNYPSATSPLQLNTATVDLDGQFLTKLTSASAFEYFDSTGAVYTQAGDADIIPANIASGVSIFGTTGTITSPIAWDLRVGSSIVTPSGTVAGLLKVNCRNGATLTTFDQSEYPKSATADSTTNFLTVTAHGWSNNQTVKIYYTAAPSPLDYATQYFVVNSTANTFQLATSSGGSAVDITATGSSVFVYKQGNGTTEIWDTIDDYLGYASATPTYTGWSSDNQCGGIAASTDDAFVWKDVTTTGDGVTASTCTNTPLSCSFKDKISGQEWHKADTTARDWTTALSFCDSLSYNGKTDWRLPSQKELQEAYNHGLMSTANSTNWITSANFQQYYWSASSISNVINNAWFVNLGLGNTLNNAKSNTNRVICVRP